MNDNKCIRVLADPVQIKECKKNIQSIQEALSDISQVLNLSGNEARLKILHLLHREGEMCPCDLSDVLEMTVPAVSQHLRKLKDVGMIKDKKVGQTIFYSIIEQKVAIIMPILNQLLNMNAKKETIK